MPAVLAQAEDEETPAASSEFLHKTGGRERIATLRDEMQKTMEESAGIYRNGDVAGRAAQTLRQPAGALRRSSPSRTTAGPSTPSAIAALELSFMLDVAEAIVHSALRREESRGAHQRTDFPARDDERFLAHSLVHRTPDGSLPGRVSAR